MANTFKLIESKVLNSNQSSITFSSIPATYDDLYVFVKGRSTRLSDNDSLLLKPNGGTSNRQAFNWSGRVSGTFNAGDVGSSGGIAWAALQGDSNTANYYCVATVYIKDYKSTSLNKLMIGEGTTGMNSASDMYKGVTLFEYTTTTAITSLEFLAANGNLKSGSSFWLYGIKNS